METVVVTGGLGRSGAWIVDRLASTYQVVCVDRTHPGFEVSPAPNVDFRAVDLTDRGQTYDLIGEIAPEYVVHWAAHPSPTRHSGGEVYETNTIAAYNVLTAAGRISADIINASSESVYGYAFGRDGQYPQSVPITEGAQCLPEDPYGTGKVVAEEIAQMVVRQAEVSAISLRPSWIQYPGEYHCRTGEQLTDVQTGDGNFWSYIDVRDVAAAVAVSIECIAEYEQPVHEPVHVMALENYFDRPTIELFTECFDAVPDESTLENDACVFSMEKADRLLDWQPHHSWREAADEVVDPPQLYIT